MKFTLVGLVVGIIVSYFSYSTISVLCEFGSCRAATKFIPLIILAFFVFIGYWIDQKFGTTK